MKTNAAIFCMALLTLAMSSAFAQTPITVVNSGFELPGTVKIFDFAEIPGWSEDVDSGDSGVEIHEPSEGWRTGEWTLFANADVGPAWQTTGETIAAGTTYTLTVDSASTSFADGATIRLYADNGGTRTILASEFQAFGGESVSDTAYVMSVSLVADGFPDSIGDLLGIELDITGGSWGGFDNVRLTSFKPPPVITPSGTFAIADESFSLSVTAGGTGYQWSDEIGTLSDGGNLTGSSTRVLTFDPLSEGDAGEYSVSFEDGVTKTVVSTSHNLFVYPSGTTLPLIGLLGLGLLTGACAMGGAAALRRKK